MRKIFLITLTLILLLFGGGALSDDWPFSDKKNVVVFTTGDIVAGKKPILYVSHDADDGAWQFHTGEDANFDDHKIVGLEEIVKLDVTLKELADLPLGWIATRESKTGKWKRSKNEE